MKNNFLSLLVMTLALTGCSQLFSETKKASNLNSTEVSTQNSESKSIEQTVNQSLPNKRVKEFDIAVRQWEYEPSVIEVNLGDTVTIRATSEDVAHSFTLPDFSPVDDPGAGFSVLLNPNETKAITFVADKAGEFMFGCDVVCGSGHTTMLGMLIVHEN